MKENFDNTFVSDQKKKKKNNPINLSFCLKIFLAVFVCFSPFITFIDSSYFICSSGLTNEGDIKNDINNINKFLKRTIYLHIPIQIITLFCMIIIQFKYIDNNFIKNKSFYIFFNNIAFFSNFISISSSSFFYFLISDKSGILFSFFINLFLSLILSFSNLSYLRCINIFNNSNEIKNNDDDTIIKNNNEINDYDDTIRDNNEINNEKYGKDLLINT